MNMEVAKLTDQSRAYETDLHNVTITEVIQVPTLTESLVDLVTVIAKTETPDTPLLSRRRLCMNPGTMASRFPLKLSNVLNLGGRDVTILGVKIMRKSSTETVKALNALLIPLEEGFVDSEKNQKLVSKYLEVLKAEVFSDKGEPLTKSRNGCRRIMSEMISSGCLANLFKKLSYLEFEDRKLVALLFCNLMRRQKKSQLPLVKYLSDNSDIMLNLISGYEEEPKALACGTIIRDCLRYWSLAKIVLESDKLHELFGFLLHPTFVISSDAFMTLEQVFKQHKRLSVDFILNNYEKFFDEFNVLIHSDNYTTKLYSLRLLTELILERHNYCIMARYVSDVKMLKIAMTLMSGSDSWNIQYEAFHAFKIFLGNPEPAAAVSGILVRNRDRLIQFLTTFQTDRKCDIFTDEKTFMINRLKLMTKPTETRTAAGSDKL